MVADLKIMADKAFLSRSEGYYGLFQRLLSLMPKAVTADAEVRYGVS